MKIRTVKAVSHPQHFWIFYAFHPNRSISACCSHRVPFEKFLFYFYIFHWHSLHLSDAWYPSTLWTYQSSLTQSTVPVPDNLRYLMFTVVNCADMAPGTFTQHTKHKVLLSCHKPPLLTVHFSPPSCCTQFFFRLLFLLYNFSWSHPIALFKIL